MSSRCHESQLEHIIPARRLSFEVDKNINEFAMPGRLWATNADHQAFAIMFGLAATAVEQMMTRGEASGERRIARMMVNAQEIRNMVKISIEAMADQAMVPFHQTRAVEPPLTSVPPLT